MKSSTIISFFLASILFISIASAQVLYSVNVALNDDGESAVKLTMTFPNVETNFNLTIKGRVENFNASSNAGPVECEVNPGLISFVNCNLSLTQERRTLYVDYETSDFVKISDKYLFDGDFNINRDVNQLTITVTLPEGTVPSGEGESLFPENATANYDISGRKLTISWSLQNLEPNQVPRFQILYEKPIQASILQYLWYFIIAGIIIAVVTAFFVIRHLRRPEKLVLSVLDDFERKVMNVIVASGGTINQKKVVQETNLSKAKVSRVVKSLANRGLIETERLGRTNKLKLVKKKLGI